MKCCYCAMPLGQPHGVGCIYSLGMHIACIPLVKESECNRELKHVKPLDTSTLGPIKLDYDFTKARAKLVRQAMLQIASDIELDTALAPMWHDLANYTPDELLAKLGRLLK